MSKSEKATKTVEERLEIVEKATHGQGRILDKIKAALEKIMGIDIDRDGKVGNVRVGALLLTFALAGVLFAANAVVWKVGDNAYVDEEGDATFNSINGTINVTSLTAATLVSNATLKVYGKTLELKASATVATNITATSGDIEATAGTVYAGVGFDVVGNVDMDIGSADVDDITLITDGTGDGEIVLPNQSIGNAELADDAVGADELASDAVVKLSLAAVDFGDFTADTDGTCTLDADVVAAAEMADAGTPQTFSL
jgi:hypothetical protein